MKIKHLELFCCHNCHNALKWQSYQTLGDDLIEGVFECNVCNNWYPITEEFGFFLDDNYVFAKEFRQLFLEKHQLSLNVSHNISSEDRFISDKNVQISFFEEEASNYTQDHTLSKFVRLLDSDLINFWKPYFPEKGLSIEMGCGTGMRTLPLAELNNQHEFIGSDISTGMIRVAIKDAKKKGLNNVSFIVSDAEKLPLYSGLGDTVVGGGILHHVPNPQIVIKEANRILNLKGHYIGIENNKTIFRFIFDLLQKIKPVWKEEAGTHPLISISELKQWGYNENINFIAKSRVFLPPQLINKLPNSISKLLFRLSESIGQNIPFIRQHGGMLFIAGTKINKNE